MEMSEYLTFDELLKRWNMQESDIFSLLEDGLQPYNRRGNPVDLLHTPFDTSPILDPYTRGLMEHHLLNGQTPYFLTPEYREENRQEALSDLRKCFFKRSDVEETESKFVIQPKKQDDSEIIKEIPNKKLRPNQRYKIECRKVAKKKWQENSSTTIADMIKRDEIKEACEGILYTTKTIRKWIHDLCPNTNPGRRPQKLM